MIPLDLLQELDKKPTYQAALTKVQEILATAKNRIIIGIAGIPGSGKSTLADYLSYRLNLQHPGQVASVSMDGFHLSKTQLNQLPEPEAAFARRGAPWTFDSANYCNTLKNFKSTPHQPLVWPSFDHSHGDPIPDGVSIPPEVKILIVEGLYVLHQDHGFEEASDVLDHRWFLDLDFELAMHQLAARHQHSWGITREQAILRIAANDELNAQIAQQSKNNADYIVHIK